MPNPARLQGKIAIVTGGNKGIGRTISVELAREGADVTVVAGHDLVGAKDVVHEIESLGRRGIALLADVTNSGSVEEMVAEAAAHFGRIDILVNNAGGGSVRLPLDEISEQDWDRVFAINTKSVFLCSTAVARRMMQQKSGVIISIAGASAHRSYPRYGAFGPAKAAVVSFTGQASLEWAPHGIRVNGVSPGPIRDPETQWQEREPELAKEVLLLPIQRAGTRWEVARTVAYLASEDAGYVTGQMIIVDGGGVNTWYLSASTSRREGEQKLWE
jgi:NAD(P)-dependent dehydrogenase (short-subunit alcohol dehydrogenase family)